jgi:hypothetical protein
MRIAFAALLIAAGLAFAPAPVMAKGPMDLVTGIPHDFTTGAKFYFSTVGGWFSKLFELLGLTEKLTIVGEGSDCVQGTRCSLGLVCVNACDGADCDVYAKRCLKGPSSVDVLGEYSLCDGSNLCSGGTFCTRICPAGSDCGAETHRCLLPNAPSGACTADAECAARCGQTPFPPIGPAAWRAQCVKGSCACSPVAFDPAATPVICPADANGVMYCPDGTREACLPAACASGICPPFLTCVTAPAFGGTCFADAECAEAACSEGAAFCDPTDSRCKCRSSQVTTIACATASDCSAAASCAANEIQACIDGACACAPAGVVTTCSAGFDKACIDSKCACTRTVPQ